MKVAIVHDWLTGMRGGERCLEAFLCLYPEADVFTLVHIPGSTSTLIDSRVRQVSVLNSIPGIGRLYRFFLPLYPLAIASFNFSGYDLVISLSHAAAKNVRVPKGIPHVCYCFTPMRYIWDQSRSYLPGIAHLAAQPILQALRWWDARGARRVTHFVAISQFVAARIRAFYKREATVIAPPVRMPRDVSHQLTDEERAIFSRHPEPFFLCAGALVPYKRIDVAVEAFKKIGAPLWVVGSGPEENALREDAPSSVLFFGRVSEAFLWECYRRCEALIFPGVEDFGIVPVECMASGRPVIAVDAGGIRESAHQDQSAKHSDLVLSNASGVFVHKRAIGDPDALVEAVRLYRSIRGTFSAERLAERAQQFSYGTFFSLWQQFAARVGIAPQAGEGVEVRPWNKDVSDSSARRVGC